MNLPNYNPEHEAKASALSLPISTKHSIEICNLLRNKTIEKSKSILQQVIDKKIPVPFKKSKNIPHRRGNLASGRFPIKASKHILKVLESVEANAKQKNLASPLKIKYISANQGPATHHYGRQRGTKAKRTHIGIIVEEASKTKQKETKQNETKPPQSKIKEKEIKNERKKSTKSKN